jgi:hypothetical protein
VLKRLPPLAILVLFAIVAAPRAAPAQERVSMTVDGFNGFHWGTPVSVILAELGDPARADTLEGGMLVLAFRDSVEQMASVAMYAVLVGEGLVKGQHSVSFDELSSTEDCEAQFIRFRKYLLLKYPMIIPEDRSRNDSRKSFCAAVQDGDAAWISTWNDSSTGARAMVVIDAGQPRLNVVYESARFIAWVDSRDSVPVSQP